MAKTYIAGEGAFKNIKTAEDLNKNGFISVREINKYLFQVLKEDTYLNDIWAGNRVQRHLDDYGLTIEDVKFPTTENQWKVSDFFWDLYKDKSYVKYCVNPIINPQEYDNSKDVKKYVSFLSQYFNRVCLSSNGHNTYYFKKSDIEKYLLNLKNPRKEILCVYTIENWGVFDKTISENSLCLSLKSPYIFFKLPSDLFNLIIPLLSKEEVVSEKTDEYINLKLRVTGSFSSLESLFDSLESIFTLCNINCTFYLYFIKNRTSHGIIDAGLIQNSKFEIFKKNIQKCYPNLKNINDINQFLDVAFYMYGAEYARNMKHICLRHGFYFNVHPNTDIQSYKDKKNQPELKSLLKYISYAEYLYISKGLGTFEIKLLKC